MPGGKENAPPGDTAVAAAAAAAAAPTPAEKKKAEKAAADDEEHVAKDDGIGPGDEKKGIAAIGWHLPCACAVLGGLHSATPSPDCPAERADAPPPPRFPSSGPLLIKPPPRLRPAC